MELEEKLKIVADIFDMILEADGIKGLKKIEANAEIVKFRIDDKKFPKLDLGIKNEEFQKLFDEGLLNQEDFSFVVNQKNKPDVMSKLTTPLEKFLFAMAWKNGDLPKLKHIINGFSDASKLINSISDKDRESAFVFYHFGRHLSNPQEEPIIDQHILRAFIIYSLLKEVKDGCNLEEISKYLKFETIRKSHVKWIKEYKKWLKSDELSKVAKIENYGYYIDRILFALGKSIKWKK